MPSKKRTIVIDFYSSVPEHLWTEALAEITESVEQIACDYAIASPDDTYSVFVEDRTPDE